MVRKLQELDRGINEKLQDESEAFLLDGIRMDVEDKNEQEADVSFILYYECVQLTNF